MSCITKLAELQKKTSPLYINERVVFESFGEYRGYSYYTTATFLGHRCGYVAVPESHPFYNLEDELKDLDVHGGVSFFENSEKLLHGMNVLAPNEKWIGFYTMHSVDKIDVNIAKYFPDCKKDIEEFSKQMSIIPNTSVKDVNYMVQECQKLIDQLIENEDGKDVQ